MAAHALILLTIAALAGVAGQAETAVGRLDTGPDTHCTAVLVTPRHVLTAAHCVSADGAIFRLGAENAFAARERDVRRAAVLTREDVGGDVMEQVAVDLALLELVRPLREPGVAPLVVSKEAPAALMILPVDAPSRPCARGDGPEGILLLECEVTPGMSGAPVVAETATGPEIFAIVSAMARRDGRAVTLAVPVGPHLEALTQRLDGTDPVFPARRVGAERQTIAEQLGRASGGERSTGVPTPIPSPPTGDPIPSLEDPSQ
ncbi:MAG: trypsin-like peptidase domain-containing protein [Pseudomonadota bacterium]